MCVFAIKKNKEGDKLTFDYNWECDRKKENVSAGQQHVESLLKHFNTKKQIETESKITIGSVMMLTKKW